MKLSKKSSIHVKMSDMKLLSFELVMGAVKSVVRGAAEEAIQKDLTWDLHV
jgi:hypothetical protein